MISACFQSLSPTKVHFLITPHPSEEIRLCLLSLMGVHNVFCGTYFPQTWLSVHIITCFSGHPNSCSCKANHWNMNSCWKSSQKSDNVFFFFKDNKCFYFSFPLFLPSLQVLWYHHVTLTFRLKIFHKCFPGCNNWVKCFQLQTQNGIFLQLKKKNLKMYEMHVKFYELPGTKLWSKHSKLQPMECLMKTLFSMLVIHQKKSYYKQATRETRKTSNRPRLGPALIPNHKTDKKIKQVRIVHTYISVFIHSSIQSFTTSYS